MESFEEYVSARGEALLRLAWVLTRDRHLAQDLVQEALARAHLRWDRIDQPDAYVRKAVLNGFLSWRRRGSSTEVVTADLPEKASRDGDPAIRTADRDEVLRLLAVLPRQQRAVLVLRHLEGLPDDEIAGLLGCSPSTVRTHSAKAMARLRATRETDGALT